jgi:ATP adenylyltransferase
MATKDSAVVASGCLFCEIPRERIILENELAYAIRDGFPVTPLHTLVIPKRHVENYFGLTDLELIACNQLVHLARDQILLQDQTVEGFNIGMNSGVVAGQTIFHCHIHLIPRRPGDVADPRGGVRHLIPGKGAY